MHVSTYTYLYIFVYLYIYEERGQERDIDCRGLQYAIVSFE